jgi:hypothetical protein
MHKHIRLLAKGINVESLVHEITRQPWLWDMFRDRTIGYGCPHSNISDIWARYRAIDDLTKPEHFAEEHDSVWYDAFYALPSIRKIVFDLMGAVQGERLGGVLITKVPPGEQVKPHVDSGWHSDYYDKYAVQLQSAPEQAFCFENEQLVTEPGDVYWFNNKYSHWVINNSNQDRMTMIVCIRSDRKGV